MPIRDAQPNQQPRSDQNLLNSFLSRSPEQQKSKEVINGIKEETRQKLAAAKAGVERNRKLHESGVLFDIDAFEKDLKTIPGITEGDIEWAKVQIWNSLPEKARDPAKTPQGIKVQGYMQQQTQEGIKKLTEEAATGKEGTNKIMTFIDGIINKYPQLKPLFPYIGAYFAQLAEKAKKENNNTPTVASGVYDQIAERFGYKSPKAKFEDFKNKLAAALPQQTPQLTLNGEYSDKKLIELNITVSNKQLPGIIQYNQETGEIIYVLNNETYRYKNVEEISKFLKDKFQPGSAPGSPEKQETDQEKYAKLFKSKDWLLDISTFETDKQAFERKHIDIDVSFRNAAQANSNVSKIMEAIKKAMPNETSFGLKLTDLLFQNFSDQDMKTALEAINNQNTFNVGRTPAEMRTFLDGLTSANDQALLTVAFNKFKKS